MNDVPSLREQLQNSTLGDVLEDNHLQQVADIATSVRQTRNTVLFSEGSAADALWVVCSGSVALDMHVPLRGSVRILTLGPRDLLGWSALVGDGSMSATATITKDADLLVLPAQQLRDLCDDDHSLGYAVMVHVARALANRLRGTRLQLLDLFAETDSSRTPSGGAD